MYKFICVILNKINDAINDCLYKTCSKLRVSSGLLLGLKHLQEEIELQKKALSSSVNTNEVSTKIVEWLIVRDAYVSLADLKDQINKVVQKLDEDNSALEDLIIVVSNEVNEIPEKKINCAQKLIICCSKPLANDTLISGLQILDTRINIIFNEVPEYYLFTSINRSELKNYIVYQIIRHPNFSNLNSKIISNIIICSIEHFIGEAALLSIDESITVLDESSLIEEEKVEVVGDFYHQGTDILF